MLYEEISKKVVHAAHLVHDELGFGFLEAVYGNALYKELCRMGIKCECQKTMDVFYKGDKVGHYIADMVIEDKIVVSIYITNFTIIDNYWAVVINETDFVSTNRNNTIIGNIGEFSPTNVQEIVFDISNNRIANINIVSKAIND